MYAWHINCDIMLKLMVFCTSIKDLFCHMNNKWFWCESFAIQTMYFCSVVRMFGEYDWTGSKKVCCGMHKLLYARMCLDQCMHKFGMWMFCVVPRLLAIKCFVVVFFFLFTFLLKIRISSKYWMLFCIYIIFWALLFSIKIDCGKWLLNFFFKLENTHTHTKQQQKHEQ
jgi:hypothetical protein